MSKEAEEFASKYLGGQDTQNRTERGQLLQSYADHQLKAKMPSEWSDNRVIDFVNWYITLHGLGIRYELENKTIMDTFKQQYPTINY